MQLAKIKVNPGAYQVVPRLALPLKSEREKSSVKNVTFLFRNLNQEGR
jgi:hypothetical protein